MSHFAEIKDGIVQRVIVADQDFINSGAVGDPATWIQTSYNANGGKYVRGSTENEKSILKNSGAKEDIDARNRKNYAGIGYTYDKVLDAFIPPKPYESWVLDTETALWQPPIPMPEDGDYIWDEEKKDWAEITEL